MRFLTIVLFLAPAPAMGALGSELHFDEGRGPPAALVRTGGDSTSVTWSLRASGGLHQMRDDLLVPLRYGGPALELGVVRERRGPRSDTSLELGTGAALGFNRYRHRGAGLWLAGTLRHVREVPWEPFGPAATLRVGLAAAGRTDDFYFFDWDDAHLYWAATYGIGPSIVLDRALGEGRALRASLDLPVVGFVGRPSEERREKVDDLVFVRTWLVDPSRGLAFAPPPDALMLDGRFRYQASDRLRYAWGLAFRTVREPRRAVLLKQTLGVEWAPRR